MLFWDHAIEVLRESIFAYAQACNGSLGAGILAVTFLARLALLPLGIRIARAAANQQRTMARLQPALDALRRTHKNNSKRLAEETSRLLTREGVSPFSVGGCLGSLAQIPVFVALYSSVQQAAAVGGRFLWIRDLAKPDWPLAIAATIFTVLATATGGVVPSQNRTMILSISAAVTIAILSKTAAGVGLYWALSSLFGGAQGWAVQRGVRSAAVEAPR
jgi:YidC/Oxa1 family membrane protein insertase